jgi:steroid 5-alpha reductase family enzyme
MVVLHLEALAGIALSLSILMAIALGWATLLAPVFMYWILVRVTGIPPLEAQMLRSWGERYRDYQSRISAFFALPPHKGVVT